MIPSVSVIELLRNAHWKSKLDLNDSDLRVLNNRRLMRWWQMVLFAYDEIDRNSMDRLALLALSNTVRLLSRILEQ